jgi:hypothetical protein
VQLHCVSCHCLTQHVSAYMAIFRGVGCYYSLVLEGICFAGFFSLYLVRGYAFARFHMCTVCVQLYCVSCHFLTLHVSAYMAIFRGVGCYYSRVLEGTCFAGFFLSVSCTWLRFCTFPYVFSCSIFLVLFSCFLRVCLPVLFFSCCLSVWCARTKRNHVRYRENQRGRSLKEHGSYNILRP